MHALILSAATVPSDQIDWLNLSDPTNVVRAVGFVLPLVTALVTKKFASGGLKAVDYLYKIAPKDGTVIGTIGRGLAFEPMLGKNEARFDPLRFTWLGSMNREATLAMACMLLAGCSGATGSASQPAKIPHIGYLDAGVLQYPSLADHPFSQGLRELGYVAGQTIVVDYRIAEQDDQRLAEMAAELAQANVDILVFEGNKALDAALLAGGTMPMVAAAGA